MLEVRIRLCKSPELVELWKDILADEMMGEVRSESVVVYTQNDQAEIFESGN